MPRGEHVTPREKLREAKTREAAKLVDLCVAAREYSAAFPIRAPAGEIDALTRTAKAWTNAYHQASRCAKHVRDGSS